MSMHVHFIPYSQWAADLVADFAELRCEYADLYGSHARGQSQAQIIPMDHDDAADHACAHAKAGLKDMLPLSSLIQKLSAEGSREVGAQVVCRACLNTRCSHGLLSHSL